MKTIYTTVADTLQNLMELWDILAKKLQNHPNGLGIFLETAHPIKNFLDTVEPALNITLPIPIR
jgi:threonine synthase